MTKFQDKILNEKLGDSIVLTVCIETKNQDDEDFYVFMNMSKKSFEKYTKDTYSIDGLLDLREYGRVIFANMGKPTDAVKQGMASMLGCDLKNIVQVQGPAKISFSS
jgi:hypothetical protein